MDQKQFELQQNVRESCEDLKNTLNDLHKWEKEIKEKEKQQQNDSSRNEEAPVVRSHAPECKAGSSNEKMMNGTGDGVQNNGKEKSPKIEATVKSEPSKKELANVLKEKGNSFVKLGSYEQAIQSYTEAINSFGSDPTFYTNRALCYLKLEKYEQCVEDCNKALAIDTKCIKAYYRRMQAYESLGEVDKSLTDCQQVLSLDPGNIEAKRSRDRIKKRKNSFNFNLSRSFQNIRDGTKITDPTWTQIDGYMKEIPVADKPPHTRSKKPLKRVPVDEILADEANRNEISDEIIDKLFNNNDCGSFKEIETKEKTESHLTIENQPAVINKPEKEELQIEEEKPSKQLEVIEPKQRKIETIPEKPKTQAQFYAAWKELTTEQKYSYFKQIAIENILKILGAGFEMETLSEILVIVSTYYVQDKCDVSVIAEIAKHDEMSILPLFLSENDREALKKIVTYMRQNHYEEDKISFINTKFAVNY